MHIAIGEPFMFADDLEIAYFFQEQSRIESDICCQLFFALVIPLLKFYLFLYSSLLVGINLSLHCLNAISSVILLPVQLISMLDAQFETVRLFGTACSFFP